MCLLLCGAPPPLKYVPKCSLNIFCCYSSSVPCHWAVYSHWFIRIIWHKLYIFLKAMKYILLFSLIFLAIFVFVPVAVTRQRLVLGSPCYFYSLILSRFYHHQEKLFCFTRQTMSQCFLVFVIPSCLHVVPFIELMHCHTSWYLKNTNLRLITCTLHACKVLSAEIRRRLQIPWIWNYRPLWAFQCGSWELSLGPVQEQQPSHLFGPALMFLLIQYIVVLWFSIYKHKSTKHVCSEQLPFSTCITWVFEDVHGS